MCLHFWFLLFGLNEIGRKAARKMLVRSRLTPLCRNKIWRGFDCFDFFQQFVPFLVQLTSLGDDWYFHFKILNQNIELFLRSEILRIFQILQPHCYHKFLTYLKFGSITEGPIAFDDILLPRVKTCENNQFFGYRSCSNI